MKNKIFLIDKYSHAPVTVDLVRRPRSREETRTFASARATQLYVIVHVIVTIVE